MFIEADSNPSRALAYIDFFTVLFNTEYSIDPIFSITGDRLGYLVLITSSRSSYSCCSIKGKITILTSRLVAFSPPSMSRLSIVDIVHPRSAEIMSKVWGLSESRHRRSRESVLELRILENHV